MSKNDQFNAYLKSQLGDRFITESEHFDILLWGQRDGKGAKPLGLTIVIEVEDTNDVGGDEQSRLSKKAKSLSKAATKLNEETQFPFFVILYSPSEKKPFLLTRLETPTNFANLKVVTQDDMPTLIQKRFKTNYTVLGTRKPVNKFTTDWFHKWSRENLPEEYVKLNIDGLILSDDLKPLILLETKASTMRTLKTWKPFSADTRNYILQQKMADKVGILFWTVFHEDYGSVQDSTEVVMFTISDLSLVGKDDAGAGFKWKDSTASGLVSMIRRL